MTEVEVVCGMVLPVASDELVREVVRRHRAGCHECQRAGGLYDAVREVRVS